MYTRAGGSEGTVTEGPVLTWYMADASLRGPRVSVRKVQASQARQCTESKTR